MYIYKFIFTKDVFSLIKFVGTRQWWFIYLHICTRILYILYTLYSITKLDQATYLCWRDMPADYGNCHPAYGINIYTTILHTPYAENKSFVYDVRLDGLIASDVTWYRLSHDWMLSYANPLRVRQMQICVSVVCWQFGSIEKGVTALLFGG